MDFYNEALEFFIRNNISLNESLVDKLKTTVVTKAATNKYKKNNYSADDYATYSGFLSAASDFAKSKKGADNLKKQANTYSHMGRIKYNQMDK